MKSSDTPFYRFSIRWDIDYLCGRPSKNYGRGDTLDCKVMEFHGQRSFARYQFISEKGYGLALITMFIVEGREVKSGEKIK